jgi:hypothetical protein
VSSITAGIDRQSTGPVWLCRLGAFILVLAALCVLPSASVAQTDTSTGPPGDSSRTYELVSPPYKVAGVGVGLPVSGGGPNQSTGAGSGAYTGERFSVSGQLGALLLDAPFATATDWALAQRVDRSVGWRSHSPVTHAFQATENYRMVQMQEASPDFSTMMWVGNAGDLPFFAEMGALGQVNNESSLVSDWGDPPVSPTRWEPIAPLEASQRVGTTASRVFLTPTISRDGTHLAVSGAVRGVAGAGNFGCRNESGVWIEVATGGPCPDPTVDTLHATAHSAYVDDLSQGLSDAWPGAGVRTPAAACTGADDGPGLPRTRIPARNPDGTLAEEACAPPAADRQSRLVSGYGSAFGLVSSPSLAGTGPNVVSGDGARTFVMAPDPNLSAFAYAGAAACTAADSGAATRCPTQLYVRQRNSDGEVVSRWISRPEPGLLDGPLPASLLGAALFEGASADGSKVFFRTNSPLTADDPNGATQTPANPNPATARSATSWDLYMFELAPGPDGDPATPDGDPTGPGSQLTRITGGPAGTSDCGTQPNAAAASAARLISADGSRVYFSCSAPLGGVADRATGTAAGSQGGTPATADQTNVYLYDASKPPAERYTFVARLPRTTSGGGATSESLTRCASATIHAGASTLEQPQSFSPQAVSCWRGDADGRFVVFWTLGRLTDDDPDEFGADASADIYAYDADADELVRVSRPQGAVDETYLCGTTVASTACYADPGMHATALGPVAPNPLLNVAVDSVSGARSVFFESAARLMDGDQNSVYDVYGWRDGALSLVSSGAADSDGTTYKGNSRDGQNVYLATRDRLTWQDVDSVLDIYTARVDGGIVKPPDPPVCGVLGHGCQGAGAGEVVSGPPASGGPSEGDAESVVRGRLVIRGLSARARARAARSGVIALRVRSNKAGLVKATGRARIGGKRVRVGSGRKRFAGAGTEVVRVKLSKRAKRMLAAGKRLSVGLSVSQSGARNRAITVRLERGDRR